MINFNGFDSQKVLDFNSKHTDLQLDIKDTSILYALKVFLSNDKLVSRKVDGVTYFWVNQTVLVEEIAVLGLNKRNLVNRLNKLIGLKLISKYTDKNAGNYSYFCITDLCKTLYIEKKETKKSDPYVAEDITLMSQKTQAPYVAEDITKEIDNIIEINNNKDKSSSSMVSAKEEEVDCSFSLQELINVYDNVKPNNTPNADLGFCKMYWNKMSKEQKEYIADIVNSRMDDLKREKKCKKFDYLLKDIVDGVEVLSVIQYENGYKPVGMNIIYNKELGCFQTFDSYYTIEDGYTPFNRPDGAHLYGSGVHYYWNGFERKWKEREPKTKWQTIDINGVVYR